MTALIAIGLDAADPAVLETWMAAGHLPTLARLKQQGCYGHLSNTEHYRAETPWTTFISGQVPEETGYWGPIKYDPHTYSVKEVGAYTYQENPPFYALGDKRKVIAFDIPQSALSDDACRCARELVCGGYTHARAHLVRRLAQRHVPQRDAPV
ncbi:MAG: alkaline phosphatase family protein, partial [Cyanobacteria bacterium P01_H01_bin.105]